MMKRKSLPHRPLEDIYLRLQAFIFSHGIRIGEFFKDYDVLNCGRVTETCFVRALEAVGISQTWPSKLFLTPQELKDIVCLYRDPENPGSILWRDFICDVDSVFGERDLEKRPEIIPHQPGVDVMEKVGLSYLWERQSQVTKNLLEEALAILRQRVVQIRPLDLRRAFIDYDKWSNYRNKFDRELSDTRRNGHVTEHQLRSVFKDYDITLTDKQFWALRLRYTDDLGFYYFPMLQDIGLEIVNEPLVTEFREKRRVLKNREFNPIVKDEERDVVQVLTRIKNKVNSERIDLRGQLGQFDYRQNRKIDRNDFHRAFDPKLNLTPTEANLLCENN
ncbi:uncharacterized protein LOC111056966 [Nilaparvata lugens]|uniref:uncharacterized protein LOC111056966 n=1 Tax=Nilaparvata lugens TaxID=108931 RepID=UPI00193E2E7F|nr:uncharacterized protein LOC111056966 [Nilaparvata lugens]